MAISIDGNNKMWSLFMDFSLFCFCQELILHIGDMKLLDATCLTNKIDLLKFQHQECESLENLHFSAIVTKFHYKIYEVESIKRSVLLGLNCPFWLYYLIWNNFSVWDWEHIINFNMHMHLW